jgi:hypothetical protein
MHLSAFFDTNWVDKARTAMKLRDDEVTTIAKMRFGEGRTTVKQGDDEVRSMRSLKMTGYGKEREREEILRGEVEMILLCCFKFSLGLGT